MSGEQLSGRVGIVNGGSRGLGRAIAWAFADEGADVAVIGRDQDALAETVAGIEERGAKVHPVIADLREVSAIPAMFDEIEGALGESDLLVNSLGVQGDMPALDVTEADWDTVIDTNLKALFFMCQEAGRRMIGRGDGGNIINMGSTFGVVGMDEFAVYAASKGGVVQLTRSLAVEWSREGVHVNAIGPTATLTEMVRPLFENNPEVANAIKSRIPAGVFPEPNDIARAAVFLAGPDSRMVHGHHLMVDCGYTIN